MEHLNFEKEKNAKGFPSPFAYHPFPMSYDTFGKSLEKNAKGGEGKNKKHNWGLINRFELKNINKFPGPQKYDIICHWKGKKVDKKRKRSKKIG